MGKISRRQVEGIDGLVQRTSEELAKYIHHANGVSKFFINQIEGLQEEVKRLKAHTNYVEPQEVANANEPSAELLPNSQ
jgi:hypothetical protein